MQNTLFKRCVLPAIIACAALPLSAQVAPHASPESRWLSNVSRVETTAVGPLDRGALDAEDAITDQIDGRPRRFAVARAVDITPASAGEWSTDTDGSSLWRLRVIGEGAAHLNFGFERFNIPEGAKLFLSTTDGSFSLGPYTSADRLPHGQLWTQVIPGEEALLLLDVPAGVESKVDLKLSSINQGYRGFGAIESTCKSGACNTDVACLASSDPWNTVRRSAGAITRGGTDTCSGSLVNNTANDRRMLFTTARHCGISAANVATVLVYWKYESPTCRTPGSSASGAAPQPKPSTSSAGVNLIAETNSPFSGAGNTGAAGTRSDFTLIELATPPQGNSFDLYWAGWDRRVPPSICSTPATPESTVGLCASIHHPGVDEKRITFVQENMIVDGISQAAGVHYRANWDPNPPILANIPAPQPTVLPPSVTEGGSSGSPLYSAAQQFVGVLSGGPSACGATGASLRDQYGGLFHAWEGLGTSTTRMRDHLDPLGNNPETLEGVGPAVVNPDVIFANGFE